MDPSSDRVECSTTQLLFVDVKRGIQKKNIWRRNEKSRREHKIRYELAKEKGTTTSNLPYHYRRSGVFTIL